MRFPWKGPASQVSKPVRVPPPHLPYACSVTPAQLSRIVWHTLRRDHPALPAELRVVIESPPRRGSGDYATGAAFQAGAALGREPYDIALALGEGLRHEPGIAAAEVVGGGFVKVTLETAARSALVRALAAEPSAPPAPEAPTESAPTPTAAPAGAPAPALASASASDPVSTGAPAPAPAPVSTLAPFDVPSRDIPRWAEASGAGEGALAVRTARSSGLFRVQYAHARARALVRNGEVLGIAPEAEAAGVEGAGLTLLALLADRARVVRPGPLTRHLDAVASAFTEFAESCPALPSGDEKPGAVHRARLALAEATAAVLADGLSQLGVTAPAHI